MLALTAYHLGMPNRPDPNPSPHLRGAPIDPQPISGDERVADLIDGAFLAYNAGRLREACRLFVEKILEPDVTVGLSLSGALTPAGLGMSTLIPLVDAGFVDWVVCTGAIVYHDAHFGIGLEMRRGRHDVSDVVHPHDAAIGGERSIIKFVIFPTLCEFQTKLDAPLTVVSM